jgi:hypothetical protein
MLSTNVSSLTDLWELFLIPTPDNVFTFLLLLLYEREKTCLSVWCSWIVNLLPRSILACVAIASITMLAVQCSAWKCSIHSHFKLYWYTTLSVCITSFCSLFAASGAIVYMIVHNYFTFYLTKVDSDAKYCILNVQSTMSIRTAECSIWTIEVVTTICIY